MKDTIKLNIKILHAYTEETKIFQNQLINFNSEEKSMYLNEILETFSTKNNIDLKNKAISYYDFDLKYYVYCGIFPFNTQIIIPFDENALKSLQEPNTIQIKIRTIQSKFSLLKMDITEENQGNLDEQNQNAHINEKSKRSKERKIGYIIEKVFLWRKLYNGFIDESGNLVKLTLEEAAERVGISKKSLDDYLIQLRIGKIYGFNFNEHKNEKVGALRAFVKKQKSLNENKYLINCDLALNEDDE
jgi:hypothetical protein